jgi:CRISPR-associated protein (TIGR03984 family)
MRQPNWSEVELDDDFVADPRVWFEAQLVDRSFEYLLVHADDGIIWGRRDEDNNLRLSIDAFSNSKIYPAVAVELRAVTIQQARLFGDGGEILIWRTPQGFQCRRLMDDDSAHNDVYDEAYLMWHQGSQPEEVAEEERFALLKEGGQGPRHAPPVVPEGRNRPKLIVRHYVDYDEQDQAYVALSRLVRLEA